MQHVLQGFNACCFAYGQTGSGKSHTMFGMQSSSSSSSSVAQPLEQYGLAPRCAQHLFASLARAHPSPSEPSKPSVFVSFLEVYLEQVRDLAFLFSGTAVQSGKRGPGAADPNNLEVYEDPSGMTLVRDLTYIQVRASVCVGQELRCRRDGRSIRWQRRALVVGAEVSEGNSQRVQGAVGARGGCQLITPSEVLNSTVSIGTHPL